MGDKSKIDKLFSGGLDDFEASPQSDSWARINATMEKKQQKKRALYWRWASVAAAVILAFYTGYYFNDNTALETYPQTAKPQSTNEKPGYISHEENSEQNELEPKEIPVAKTQSKKIKNDVNPSVSKPQEVVSNTSFLKKAMATKSDKADISNENISKQILAEADESFTSGEEAIIASNFEDNSTIEVEKTEITSVEKIDATVVTMEEPQVNLATPTETPTRPSPETLDYTEKQEISKPTFSRFSISALVSPTFPFTDITVNQSDETTEGNVNQEKLKTGYTYGLGLGYRLSKKLELQTGLMVNNWSQEASEVKLKITPSAATSVNTSVDASGNISSGNVNFSGLSDPTNQGKLQTANVGGQTYSVLPGLKESYQFIEIPIALGYYLVDSKRWYVKANIGLNSRFLTQSNVTLIYADGSEVPYEHFDLQTYSMQLIGGVGGGVKFGQHWEFGLHPTLLYGITQVNTHSEVDTYFHQVLIYSSLSYRF